MADKQEMLYQALTRELDILKNDLLDEMRSSAAQVESLCESVKNESSESCELITKEIRYGYKQNENIYNGVESILKDELDAKLSAVDEKIAKIDQLEKVLSELEEIKANYKQLQEVYEGMSSILANDVSPRIDSIESKTALLDNIDKTMAEVNDRLAQAYFPTEEDCKNLANTVSDNVDVHSQRILDAVAAIPTPDEVDYSRIVSEVGDRLLDILNDMKAAQEPAEKIDYNRIVDDTAAKVIDAIPQPEAVDYARIEEAVKGLDVNAVAAAVAAMVTIPQPEVDYDRLADLVAEKLAAKEQVFDVVLDDAGIEKISDQVAAKVADAATVDYDKVCRAAQAAQILPDPVDYDRISEIMDSKLAADETESTFDLVLDEEGIQAIAKGVAEELRSLCCVCESEPAAEAPVEETVEAVEETVEQPVEESAEEPVVESAADTSNAEDELAVSVIPGIQELSDGTFMDAETGLVIRLKKSFTAKMKQSEEKVKEYYSALKNELVSYKKINSNVSWHGDRFNYGRDTVAKINICGKTLGLYLALDPNDEEEFKTTVYHQKDVSSQKAYEHTPFMVKVKSDAAVKKAVRLIVALAAKLATEKDEDFVETDYVAEFGYATTKQLYEEGHIKATKEKKVDLNF